MKRGALAASVLLLVLLASCSAPASEQSFEIPSSREDGFEVVSIVDGDTLKIDNGEAVRLIGIDAPEQNEAFYEESSYYLAQKIIGSQVVSLEPEGARRDQFGRLLRHVFIANENVAVELVQQGHARVVDSYDGIYKDELMRAQSEAQTTRRGIWA